MNILISILLVLGCVIAFILVLALFMRKQHYVKREITINAPQQKVFAYIKLLENQDKFNRHAMAGSDRKKEFKGTDGTVGFIYSWSGDKDAGVGEKEIMNVVEGKSMEAEIRFTKPLKAMSRVIMETEALPNQQTKVSWSNAGSLPYPVNIMIPMMEKMLPKEMDASLVNLKNILEK